MTKKPTVQRLNTLKYIKSFPELFALILATSACYLFLETQIDGMAFGGQGSFSGVDIIVISFLVSVIIAIVAVIAGVGGGVIIDGTTVYGSQGIGGEWGHTIVTDSGDECYCGKRGCVESVISGRALQFYYDKISGKKLKFEEIYALKDTDKHANETFKRLITHFGKGLSNVVNIIDPEVIVLGGGLSNIDELYTEGYNELKKYVFNPTFSTPILRPKLGDSAGVYGAALL